MDYLVLKAIHVGAVCLSSAGFLARGIGRFAGAHWVESPTARTLPHLVDSVLLASAIALALSLRLSPLSNAWLLAKIVALCVYIGLGMVALRFGRTRRTRAVAWFGALLVFAYIVTVAITKNPRGLFA
jgi:uncharacterized membrane protein SirB2